LSYVALGFVFGSLLAFAAFVGADIRVFEILLALWMVAGFGLALYGARGMQYSGLGLKAVPTLLYAPFYVFWKIVLARPFKHRKNAEWVRTEREGPPT